MAKKKAPKPEAKETTVKSEYGTITNISTEHTVTNKHG